MRPRPYWPRSVVTDPPKAGSVCRIEAHAPQRPTSSRRRRVDQNDKPDTDVPGLVFRLDVYVGERDSYGVGFSDNVIFRKQYYVQVYPRAGRPAVFVHTGERFLGSNDPQYEAELGLLADNTANGVQQLARNDAGDWTFAVDGTGFAGRFRIAIEAND